MRRVWGHLRDEDIAKAVHSPTDHRSGIYIHIIKDFLDEPQLRGTDLFGALSCFERWRKVRDMYIERGYIRDTSDEEENAAREIWNQAMKELDKQGYIGVGASWNGGQLYGLGRHPSPYNQPDE